MKKTYFIIISIHAVNNGITEQPVHDTGINEETIQSRNFKVYTLI